MNIDSSLVNELRHKEYRDAYVASQIRIGIPFQIRALRNQRHWSQGEFAERVGMSQPRVSEMERPGERRPNIETLLRIAAALDVGLQVRFVSFSELVEWAENFSPDDFSVPSFNDEIAELTKGVIAAHSTASTGALIENEQWGNIQKQFPTLTTPTASTIIDAPGLQEVLSNAGGVFTKTHRFGLRGTVNSTVHKHSSILSNARLIL